MGATTVAFLDYSGEKGVVRFHHPDLNIVNVEAYTSGVPLNTYNQLMDALDDLTIGERDKETVNAEILSHGASLPSDTSAQRERKAMVTYRDTVTGVLGRFEIPTFGMIGAVQGTDVLDISGVEWQALVLVVETSYTSPLLNPVVILSARHVGRAS